MGYEFNPADVHINQGLADLSIKYTNEDTIWRKVAPIRNVKKRSDRYYVYDKAMAFEITDDATAPNSDANEITVKISDDNYSVRDRALGTWVPVTSIENADDALDPLGDALQNVREQLENRHEFRTAQFLFSQATYGAAQKVTLSGTGQWSDYTNSDPLLAITTQIDNMIMKPNRLVLGADTWRVLRQHPKIASAIFPLGGNANRGGAMATTQAVADLLELNEVVVGRARVNTAAPGQAATMTRCWGKHALLARIDDNPGDKTVTLAATFSESQSNPVRDFDAKKGVKGAEYVKDGWNEVIKLIAGDVGFFFENAVV